MPVQNMKSRYLILSSVGYAMHTYLQYVYLELFSLPQARSIFDLTLLTPIIVFFILILIFLLPL